MRRALPWIGSVAATVAAGRALGAAGLPSPYLFTALLVGIAVALAQPRRDGVPDAVFTAAQAVTGVVLGAYLQSSSLSALGGQWLPVLLVSAATLVVSLAAGALLARAADVDRPTAALGLVAGGRRASSAWPASWEPTTGSWPSCSTCASSWWCC